MGLRSRNKGKLGEREAAAEIRRLFGVEARRGRQYCGSDDAPDVVTGIEGVHFEVKRTEGLRLYPALDQATGDAPDKIPVVLHRANNQPWVAIVRLDDLPRLASALYLTLAQNA
jgi:Holliday junction resolvase